MHGEAADVVWVRLKRNDLFMRVVVEHAQLEIVRTGNEPILARDKTHTSYGYFCDFECLYERARFKVVGVYTPIVQSSKEPGFSRVKVDRLDAIRALEKLSLWVQFSFMVLPGDSVLTLTSSNMVWAWLAAVRGGCLCFPYATCLC